MVMPPQNSTAGSKNSGVSATATEKRMAIRKFYSEAHTTTTDKQGRILLSDKHCDRAGITNEVIFAGGRSRSRSGASDATPTSMSVNPMSTGAWPTLSASDPTNTCKL